jgi:hypothetical protein
MQYIFDIVKAEENGILETTTNHIIKDVNKKA